jgi:hypothetical protein
MDVLPFITDEKLFQITKKFVDDFEAIERNAEAKLASSELDPFSALLFTICSDSTLLKWKEGELSRQIGKSFQNKIGEFHQNILGSCHNWEVIDNVIDIRCVPNKIIAEIKNKYNTTKGSDKKGLYDNFKNFLARPEYNGYTAYYVEVIPQRKRRYNAEFAPSDNLFHDNRFPRADIRVIDGYSFYELVTGYKNAMLDLYNVLPSVINRLTGKQMTILSDPLFKEIFQRSF